MAVTSGFYNSVNHDRKYNAMQIANLLDGVINDGVFMTVGDHFAVTENSGMTIKVGIGRAWFNMTWLYNDSQLVLAVEPSDLTLPRIDAVVVEVNTSQEVRASTIKIVKGTPNASPVAPTMVSTATIHQYPLAFITVDANVSTITGSKITNKVGTTSCPYVNGLLETSTVEAQTAAWEAMFNEWFDGVKDTLDEEVAGNLLNLINLRVRYEDKASDADILAGSSETKFVTPAAAAKLKTLIRQTAPDASTVGMIGQLCLDEVLNELYQCVKVVGNVYTWDLLTGDRLSDIRVSNRTTLGDKYLAANGQKIWINDYPELYAMLTGPRWRIETLEYASNAGHPKGFNYVNGRYCVTAFIGTTPYVYHSPSYKGPWTRVALPMAGRTNSKVVWTGTYYVAISRVYESPYTSYLCYSTDLVTWNYKILNTTSDFSSFDILNGYFVMTYSNTIYYGLIDTAISTGALSMLPSINNFTNIVYFDGKFMYAAANKLYHSPSITGPWTEVVLNAAQLSSSSTTITICNNEIVLTNVNTTRAVFAKASSVNGPWTYYATTSVVMADGYSKAKLCWANGYYYIHNKATWSNGLNPEVYWSVTMDGPFTKAIPPTSGGGIEVTCDTPDIYNDNSFPDHMMHFVGFIETTTDTMWLVSSSLPGGDLKAIPSVSIANVNSFIRAKP